MSRYKFEIGDEEMGVPYRDSGLWRSYHLTTFGENRGEMIEFADISEIDQDGGEIRTYALSDAPTPVLSRALQMIELKFRGVIQ